MCRDRPCNYLQFAVESVSIRFGNLPFCGKLKKMPQQQQLATTKLQLKNSICRCRRWSCKLQWTFTLAWMIPEKPSDAKGNNMHWPKPPWPPALSVRKEKHQSWETHEKMRESDLNRSLEKRERERERETLRERREEEREKSIVLGIIDFRRGSGESDDGGFRKKGKAHIKV